MPLSVFKNIITNALACGANETETQLIVHFYKKFKLDLPIHKHLHNTKLIRSYELRLKQPLQQLKEWHRQQDWTAFDKTMKAVEGRVKKEPLVKHSGSYEESVRMAIDSWRIRQHKPRLLTSMAAYDQIKLSTFCTHLQILHRRISLAACCF